MSKLVITAASGPVAALNLTHSVKNGVPFATIASHPAAAAISGVLEEHVADGLVRMWGSVAGSEGRHAATWQRIDAGDWIAFYVDGRFRLAARIYARLDSPELGDAVWSPDPTAGSYRYLTFFDAVTPIDVSPRAMSAALGYGGGYIYRGFLVPAESAQSHLANEYGSVEVFLGLLAEEQAALSGLAGDSAGLGYVSDLAGFDSEESQARLEEALREHLKDGPPDVVEARIRRIKRDRRLVQKLKQLYAGRCQRCEFTFAKRDSKPYSEAAHLNRIADRLPGIDSPDNLVILCANCHRMLDYGTLEIYWDEGAMQPVARLNGSTSPLALNEHIRMKWAPAEEWATASEADLEWDA